MPFADSSSVGKETFSWKCWLLDIALHQNKRGLSPLYKEVRDVEIVLRL